MSDNICKFCHSIVGEDGICPKCGFPRVSANRHVAGTLAYGTRLGDYTVGDVITMDGESTSYLSYDARNSRRVIVKEFLPVSMIGGREGNIVKPQRGKEVLFKNLMMDFVDVHTAVAKANSRSIQAVYDIISANGTAYAILEYIKGETLKENLISRGEPYSFREARWLFKDLFRAVETLEALNMAHGGISDENVMVTAEGSLVLTGFAIRDLRVRNEHIMYKLYDGFSAPEQYSASKFAGLYTDIYSVAALFFNAVTCRLYYPGAFSDENIASLFPDTAILAITRATRNDPKERTNNITVFADGLDGKRAATTTRTVEVAVAKAEKISKVASITDSFDKKYIPFIVVGVIIVIFAIALLGLTSRGDSSYTDDSSSYIEDAEDDVIVPDLRGKLAEDVIYNTEYTDDFQFEVSYVFSDDVEEGKIVSYNPEVGTVVDKGTKIYLNVSKGPEEEDEPVYVPDGLKGLKAEAAEKLLTDMGIKYAEIKVQSKDYAAGYVTGTDKVAGTRIDTSKDTLLIYVSDGSLYESSSSEAESSSSEARSSTPTTTETPEEQTPTDNTSTDTGNTAENPTGE